MIAVTGALPHFVLDVAAATQAPESVRGAVVAIGSFDGVHRAHQALIEAAATLAAERGTRPIALTFEPHPRSVLQPDAPLFRLTQPAQKRQLLGIVGAQGVIDVVFSRDLAVLSPEEFVERILVERLGVKGVVVGEGFRFGRKRAGDTDLLSALGEKHGYRVATVPTVMDGQGQVISSGRVREALQAGDIAAANRLLGYRWFVAGTVVTGDKRGRELGYPTANVALPAPIGLRHGIYAVAASWPGSHNVAGVASYGIRPTFGGGEALLEVHLFDRDDDLYGRAFAVTFLDWLRAEERFDSVEALIRQMDADSAAARAINATAGGGSEIDRALAEGA